MDSKEVIENEPSSEDEIGTEEADEIFEDLESTKPE